MIIYNIYVHMLYTYILYLNILMRRSEARILLFAFPNETHDRGTRPAGFARSIASNADARACTRVRGSFCLRNFGKLTRQLGHSMPRNRFSSRTTAVFTPLCTSGIIGIPRRANSLLAQRCDVPERRGNSSTPVYGFTLL